MFTSFSTALSALDATSTAIDVVGNNLANLNTPGFKDSTTYFRDLVTESLGAGLGSTDIGVRVGGGKQRVVTTSLSLDWNLNSHAAADSRSDHSETIKVYDTLGTSHTLTMNFEKTGANTWSYAVTIPGEDLSGGTAGTPVAISGASGTLTFGTNGQLTSPAPGAPINIAITGLAHAARHMPPHLGRRPSARAGGHT